MVWMKLFLNDAQGITFKPTKDMIRSDINNYIDLIEREAPRILVEEVVQNARKRAAASGLDPALAEQIWRGLIDWSIAREEQILGADKAK